MRKRRVAPAPDLPTGEELVTVPDELPILPLRDTVLFPNSFMPLAVARESSVQLIDEAIAGSKVIGVVTQRDASVEEPQQDDLYVVGTASQIHKMFKLPDGSLRLIVQGLSRLVLDDITATKPYLRARVRPATEALRAADRTEIDALMRNIKTNFQKVVSLSPLLSEDLQTLAGTISEPGRLADFIASSLTTLETAVRQQVLETLDVRGADGPPEPDPDQGARGARAGVEDPVAGPVGSGQEPARILPARAVEGDPEGAGGRRRPDQGNRRAAPEDRRGRAARGGAERSAARAGPPGQDAGGGRRVHRVADLSRLDRDAAVAEAIRRDHRPAAHQGDPGRRPRRAGEGQGPHPRVPGRPQAEPVGEGADPVLRRTARRWQDVAGALDRHVARPQVRARVAGRHARRGRDSRPPPHLHRRPAGPDHPGPAPRRDQEPGLHPGRDRQAGVRLPRRPGVGAARSAGPRAELQLPRPLSRRARSISPRSCSSPPPTCWIRCRRRCATGWKCWRFPATPSRRSWPSPSSTWCSGRSRTTA